MKKYILHFIAVLFVLGAQAQPLLVGATFTGCSNGDGSIITYTAGARALNSVLCLPSENTTSGPDCVTLTEAPNGKLYGLNGYGGATLGHSGLHGTLYEYDITTDTYRDLVAFDSATTGDVPASSLLLASDGLLYGVTTIGGANDGGTLFSYAIGDTFVTKLADIPAGANANSVPIQAQNGMLYGMTQEDGTNHGGTIFQYNITSGVYTVVNQMPFSAAPVGSLLEIGADTLYGLTGNDGLNSGGTVFRFVIGPNTYTVLYNLDAGAQPSSNLAYSPPATVYGMTYLDGANQAGTLFSFNIRTDSFKVLYNFGATDTDAAYPYGGPTLASNGLLYGLTSWGGPDSAGALFQYNITTSTYTKMLDLYLSTTGGSPSLGQLTEYKAPSGIPAVQQASGFRLYPDPTTGIFTIDNSYQGVLSVQVINLLGERLREFSMSGPQGRFDISSLPAGIYQVQISDERQTLKVLKVVKD